MPKAGTPETPEFSAGPNAGVYNQQLGRLADQGARYQWGAAQARHEQAQQDSTPVPEPGPVDWGALNSGVENVLTDQQGYAYNSAQQAQFMRAIAQYLKANYNRVDGELVKKEQPPEPADTAGAWSGPNTNYNANWSW